MRSLVRRLRGLVDASRHVLRWHDSESKLIRDADAWWQAPPPGKRDAYAHWRGGLDDATWQAIGQEHLLLFERFAKSSDFATPPNRIVEWGCGGGANAVHFAPLAQRFIGVDVSDETLAECDRQLATIGVNHFTPVRIDVASPERAANSIAEPCDLFLCFYVFELLPSPAYAERIVKIAAKLLRPGGMAIIQIRYPAGLATQSRRWGYRLGVANMTSFEIAEFWQLAERCGFDPHAVVLKPNDARLGEERYAYCVLTRRGE